MKHVVRMDTENEGIGEISFANRTIAIHVSCPSTSSQAISLAAFLLCRSVLEICPVQTTETRRFLRGAVVQPLWSMSGNEADGDEANEHRIWRLSFCLALLQVRM